MYYIDTHCHYDLRQFNKTRWGTLGACKVNGIEKIIIPAILSESNLLAPAQLDYLRKPELLLGTGYTLQRLPQLFFAAGVHPNRLWSQQQLPQEAWAALIRDAAQQRRCVAIGETGLDHHLPLSPDQMQDQYAWFHRQLELAEDAGLPVILHIRDAAEDAISILREHPLTYGGVVHCFCDGWETARQYLALGLKLGLGGSVTLDGMEALREAVRRLPADGFVLETDGPYVKPKWLLRGPNSSLSIPGIARYIAELRGTTQAELCISTTANAEALFPL